jgi:2-iminobutanoate/2-iminopropanoate deaminase
MPKRTLSSSAAPKPVAGYSQAVIAAPFVFCSGQIPIDPATHELVAGGSAEQTERVLENLGAVLKEGGLGYDDIVKCTVYLSDMADFAGFDATYRKYFGTAPPARATVAVSALPRGARIEVDAIALMQP